MAVKTGIIIFKETKNIGDDIQTYAAFKRLKKIDYFIERERMNEFKSENKETVKTILNGWFLHERVRLPLSPYIEPLFISSHFSGFDDFYGISDEYLDGYMSEYLKRYEPVGARDKGTLNRFKQRGIDTYLSHCLTLTIPRFKSLKQEKKISLVDVSESIVKDVEKNYKDKVNIVTHTLDKEEHSLLSNADRMKKTEDLLKEYQSSELVITSRLHCALPCLALEVPVLLIMDNDSEDIVTRLGDFLFLLNHTTEKEFLSKGFDHYKDIKVKKDHYDIQKELIKTVDSFMKKDIKDKKLDYKEELVKNNQRMNDLLTIRNTYSEEYRKRSLDMVELEYSVEYWSKEFHTLLKKYEDLKKENHDIKNQNEELLREKNRSILEKLKSKFKRS